MAEAQKLTEILNTLANHIHNIGDALKCLFCLNLLNEPRLLPCGHVICKDCVPNSAQSRSSCPSCEHHFNYGDARSVPELENVLKIYRSVGAAMLPSLSTDGGLVPEQPAREKVYQTRSSKRLKKMSNGTPEIGALTFHQESSTESAAIRSLCAFCHSSKLSEDSGPMLYYAHGKEVVGNAGNVSNVIPAHQRCIDWTPQVYYEGEEIKNLESELARAGRLKCSSCGFKGAGLGCFAKSCRKTYHVPCAFDIQECRKDYEDLYVLCPKHNDLKFPKESEKRIETTREKSKKTQKCSSSTKLAVSSKQPNFWESSQDGPKEWVFCGSALSSKETDILVKFASMCGATVNKYWKPNVTHVIAATDELGACIRTFKVLRSILHGKWILTMDWVKACMEANSPKNEEPYEVELDNYWTHHGPKTGRLRVLNNEPKLFNGLRFHFTGDFVAEEKLDLVDLVENGGGITVESKKRFLTDRQSTSSTGIIVYNCDPPQGCPSGEEGDIVSQRLAKAQDIAMEATSQVVPHTWILESVAACKLQPFGYFC